MLQVILSKFDFNDTPPLAAMFHEESPEDGHTKGGDERCVSGDPKIGMSHKGPFKEQSGFHASSEDC